MCRLRLGLRRDAGSPTAGASQPSGRLVVDQAKAAYMAWVLSDSIGRNDPVRPLPVSRGDA